MLIYPESVLRQRKAYESFVGTKKTDLNKRVSVNRVSFHFISVFQHVQVRVRAPVTFVSLALKIILPHNLYGFILVAN